jgi:hypothetical protein
MIDSIQIICERHSGSNWFVKLLNHSFNNKIQINDLEKHWFLNEYKLNHFLETSSAPLKKMKNNCIKRNISFNNFNDITKNNILVIIIVRDVYDWILGMKKDPHHFSNKQEIINMSISNFIKMKWNNNRDITPYSILVNNVVDLRTKKYINWFKYIPQFCKNVEIFKYEDILLNYKAIIKYLCEQYNFKLENDIKNQNQSLTQNKIDNSLYFNKKLIDKFYSKKDLYFIKKFIKLDIEKELGYL